MAKSSVGQEALETAKAGAKEDDPATIPPLPPILALPDSVLMLMASWLPSPDKKATRLVCRALRTAVSGAVCSLLVTDGNLPFLAPPPEVQHAALAEQPQHQPYHHHHQTHHQRLQRRHPPLHVAFPNLTHLCLALSPAGSHDSRAAELLRSLLRTSLPPLRCLRCLDLSLACRDMALGRTARDMYDTWCLIAEGLPAGRPVRVLLHPPAALPGGSATGVRQCAIGAVAPGALGARDVSKDRAKDRADQGGSSESSSRRDSRDAAGREVSSHAQGRPGTGTCGNAGDGGSANHTVAGAALMANMLTLLAARHPAAEVRFVTAPLASKRYDKPRIPTFGELLATLAPPPSPPPAAARWCCPLTGLVLGPESFDPATAAAAANTAAPGARAGGPAAGSAAAAPLAPWLIPNPLQQPHPTLHHPQRAAGGPQAHPHPNLNADPVANVNVNAGADAGAYALRRAAQRPGSLPAVAVAAASSGGGGDGGGGGLAWLPLLATVNGPSRPLEHLALWEAWPLAALLGAEGGGGGGAGRSCTATAMSYGNPGRRLGPGPAAGLAPPCLLGLRRLVLSDQQAVLDRDRLSAEALSPLAALPHLTRLEVASLTINAAAAAAAAAAGRCSGGGGSGGAGSRRGRGRCGRGLQSRGGGPLRTHGSGAGGKSAAGGWAMQGLGFTSLPQVRHLSVYHALRIIWPPDGPGPDCDGGGGGPLGALFPSLAHLSACVTPGSPGRPASERWGYLAGLGPSLTSLHLRAVAADDLCLQGRSEVLAALTRVTALRLSAESGKVDGLRSLARSVACLGPGLAALRLSRLGTRGIDPRASELSLPRLTRLDFWGCSGELVAAFDGLALSAVRLRRMEVRDCETLRPGDLQWALERQVGLRQLVIRNCPGLASKAAMVALRAARPSLAISVCTTDGAEARALRRSRRAAGMAGGPVGLGAAPSAAFTAAVASENWLEGRAGDVAGPGPLYGITADDLEELWG